jgi:hypothetical protein
MADNTLRVDPDVLSDGARRLRSIEREPAGYFDPGPHRSGAPAGTVVRRRSTGNQMWSGLYERFAHHLDALADNADNLHTAAGMYRNQDENLGAGIDQQM